MMIKSGSSGIVLAALALALAGAGCSKKDPKPAGAAASASAAAAKAGAPSALTPSPEACRACEQKGVCAEFVDACSKFEGEARGQCEAVEKCVQASNCADGEKTLTSCYCGELKTSACIEAPFTGPGAPAGPCADVIRASMGGASKNNQVLTRYIRAEYPGGAALARITCDKVDPACKPLCGF